MIVFDWMYAQQRNELRPDFPIYLYDKSPFNDLRAVNPDGIRRSIRVLLGETIFSEAEAFARYKNNLSKSYAKFQSPESIKKLDGLIEAGRGTIDAKPEVDLECNNFTAIANDLIPAVKGFAESGTLVDIIIPAYSFAFYYEWRSQISDTLLEDQLVTRSCLVEGLDGVANTRIFAFDAIDWVSGDLSNYWDTGHIYREKPLQYILTAIAEDRHRLTKVNLEDYIRGLREQVKTVVVRNK
ncbi:MAG: hypothetical protein B7Y80_18660 [Hyphomicrobium sp. 32-62-53]|nr:MAG: hypothetical protein B7Z29_19745 [Hyphomicrobium sp. 12-62-95]OYX97766.1 MAG: hypothetical protein B7Y80_18660 [Hyphomicrobium sp. 32-62-53]